MISVEKLGDKTKRKESGGEYGGFNEPAKKMTDEEYEKYLVEVKKGVFALKKIIAYANKVSQLANENDCTLVNKLITNLFIVDFDVKGELEVVYADIEDAKVGEFLKSFMADLCVIN